MQQFIQDRILLSIYPGCSIEEARLKDFNIGCGCDRGNYPPTLSRVLTALGEVKGGGLIQYHYATDWDSGFISTDLQNKPLCNRKLLNSDGTDATLFDQSEETQKAIALLLGWKDE